MPESLTFPIKNGLGVSNDRFGFIWPHVPGRPEKPGKMFPGRIPAFPESRKNPAEFVPLEVETVSGRRVIMGSQALYPTHSGASPKVSWKTHLLLYYGGF